MGVAIVRKDFAFFQKYLGNVHWIAYTHLVEILAEVGPAHPERAILENAKVKIT